MKTYIQLALMAAGAWWCWTAVLPLLSGGGATVPSTEPAPVPPGGQASGGDPQQTNDAGDFYRQVVGNLNREWSDMLGSRYRKPVLVLFAGQTRTGQPGVTATARIGPIYVPEDGKIYVPVSLANEVRQLGGCSGNPCNAVIAAVVAHEMGHRVQHLVGLMGGAASGELQADCLAGAVLSHENARLGGKLMEPGDLEAIAQWQYGIGDDVIGGGRPVPPDLSHGTGAQRQQAFQRGWQGGTLSACTGRGGAA